MQSPSILIVGAGPTGMVLALFMERLGLRARIIDKSDTPGTTSRAMAVQARTLEFYRQIDLADEVLAAGIKMDHVVMRRNGVAVARAPIGDFGQGMSPFPFVLSFPQDDHERLLNERLVKAGIHVERGTELIGLTQDNDKVRVNLRRGEQEERAEVDYVCGCDGARSAVRGALGAEFPGGTYGQVFYVADVRATGAAVTGGVNVCFSRDGFGLVMPVRSSGSLRLIGVVPAEFEAREHITYEDIAPDIIRQTRLNIEAVNWFSTYHVHHRVVDHFRHGRVFLSGDAAHIHSPAGGQGMNTGIGDAVNLAWKLAAVAQGRASAKLLDSYEPERIAFARTLVATTDQVFKVAAGRSWADWIARGYLIPRAAGTALRFSWAQRLMFRILSQVRIAYPDSPLSHGTVGEVRAGDRLPWVLNADGAGGDNFMPLRSLDWQIHVYGAAGSDVRELASRRRLPLHEFPWSERAGSVGLTRDAAYLVRPDGHVAVAAAAQTAGAIEGMLEEFQIAPASTSC